MKARKGPVAKAKGLIMKGEKEYERRGMPHAKAVHVAFAVAGKVGKAVKSARKKGRK